MTKPAPYATDVRAKGWRFEIDYEKVEQSDTWSLAAEVPMAQHALLMMWLVAWTQVPCGSFPHDEALIRAKCRIPPKSWAGMRDVLMRGWWLAEDGRLYHDTIVSRVREMLEYRRKETERRNRNRGKADVVPDLSRGTAAEQAQDTTGAPGTGTGTSTSLRSVEQRASRLPKPFDLPVEWAEWAKAERPDLDPHRVADKFADYWHGKGGAAGRKLDWLATWRNWVREERAPAVARQPYGAPKHAGAAAAIFDMDRQEVIDA